MKHTFFYILCFIILFFTIKNEVLGSSGETTTSSKTIVEINSNIQELEKEKTTLDNKWDTFKSQYSGITGFIKKDITEREAFEIQEITYIYNSKKKTYELQLVERVRKLENSDDIKKNLRDLKKEFYKDIANYIQKERLPEFLEYIKGDIELNEKNKEIKEELYKEKVVLQEKVEVIKEKIEEHQKILNERIEKRIRIQIAEKIKLLKENPRYKLLNEKGKEVLFKKALEKTLLKKSELEKIENKTSVIQKKIELYNIVKEELEKELPEINAEQ